MHASRLPALLFTLLAACQGGQEPRDADLDDTPGEADVPPATGWPSPNEWSWNGSWEPDFPIPGLLDDEYFDGHPGTDGEPSPVLPPGSWDWDDPSDDLANWRNFEANLGSFEMLLDAEDRHYGWRLRANDPEACDYSGPAAYFEGSSGADVLDLGPGGLVHSFASGNLAGGPDVLVFKESWSLDLRTGSSESAGSADDDLVMAGCGESPDGSFDVMTSTIHTGPGSDWVFVRDISRAAVDLGNGAGGRTDAVDPLDGDDLVVLRGNTHDFRVYGGGGDDTAVWYADENVQTTTWLGPDFFGSGGWGDAAWDDEGTDRLVLAVPDATPVVTATPTPPGSILVRATTGDLVIDEPTADDPFARYCVECGTSTGGRMTVILEYVSADDSVRTGYFFVTAFEELQVGVGSGANVYAIDDVAGEAIPLPSATPFIPPTWPSEDCP